MGVDFGHPFRQMGDQPWQGANWVMAPLHARPKHLIGRDEACPLETRTLEARQSGGDREMRILGLDPR